MTRIIGGSVGGRRLETPRGRGTRPTSDRVREALFSMLAGRDVLRGATVLDAYAGSGALGLEAASRGAARVVFVESDRAAARLIARNADTLGLHGLRVHANTVASFASRADVERFDLVLADPPYGMEEAALAADLAALAEQGRLADDVLLIVERSRRSPEPAWPAGFAATGERRYGETTIWLAEPDQLSRLG